MSISSERIEEIKKLYGEIRAENSELRQQIAELEKVVNDIHYKAQFHSSGLALEVCQLIAQSREE